jgi:hypothetical protein
MIIDGTNGLTFNNATTQASAGLTGSTSQLCKAWVRFSVSGTTPTITKSYNISSVTYNSTGYYSFAFTTAQSDANYTANGTSGINTAAGAFVNSFCFSTDSGSYYSAPTTSGFTMAYVNTAGAFSNPSVSCVVVFD